MPGSRSSKPNTAIRAPAPPVVIAARVGCSHQRTRITTYLLQNAYLPGVCSSKARKSMVSAALSAPVRVLKRPTRAPSTRPPGYTGPRSTSNEKKKRRTPELPFPFLINMCFRLLLRYALLKHPRNEPNTRFLPQNFSQYSPRSFYRPLVPFSCLQAAAPPKSKPP